MRVRPALLVIASGLSFAGSGCRFIEDLQLRIAPPPHPHGDYAHGLESSGLANTPPARQWLDAAATALASPDEGTLPFREEGWFAPEAPTALGVRFRFSDRQPVDIIARLQGEDSTRVFIDVFRLSAEPGQPPARIASAADTARSVSFRPRRGDDILVRVQPELLRGGAWEVIIMNREET